MRKSRAAGAALVGALLVGFGLWRGRLRRFEVKDHSMSPALDDGDYVVATRLDSAPMRGDVVVFPHPNRHGFLMIKRVIGLPQETVHIEHGEVAVNGHLLAEPWSQGSVAGVHEWHLGGREIVVLSDKRNQSTEDSRELGALPLRDLWRVAFRYWPPGRAGRIS